MTRRFSDKRPEDGLYPIGWKPFYVAGMADVTIRIQGHRAGVLTVARSGALTRDTGPVDEQDVTSAVRALTDTGRHELAGRVQGWWWTFGAA